MNLKIVFLAVSWHIAANVACQNLTENFFTVFQAHFDPDDNRTIQNRYIVNDDFFDQTERSVVFLLLNDDVIREDWSRSSSNVTWLHYAQQFGALALQIEHRYYGKSLPMAQETRDILYVTIDQIMEDTSRFIEGINRNYTFKHEPQWIVFGGSYAGALCSFARYKLPHLIKGAVCSSPTLLSKVSFPEFYDTVAADIKETSEECLDVIAEGFKQVQELAQNQSGREFLQNTALDLCQNITDVYNNEDNPEDFLALLIHNLARDIADIAQFNKVNRLEHTKEQKKYTLDKMCTNFVTSCSNANKSAVIRLGEHFRYHNGQSCLDFNYTALIKNSQILESPARAKQFQKCFQLGIATDRVNGTPGNAFGTIPQAEWWIKQCSQIFDQNAFSASNQAFLYDRIRLVYGGIDIGNKLSNTVHVQGSFDPWHKLGILESNNPDFTVIFINGTAHCADQYASRENDPPQLTAARAQIQQLISSWIS